MNSASDAALTISRRVMGNALLIGGLYPADGSADRFQIGHGHQHRDQHRAAAGRRRARWLSVCSRDRRRPA
jgi:hypothetical protein